MVKLLRNNLQINMQFICWMILIRKILTPDMKNNFPSPISNNSVTSCKQHLFLTKNMTKNSYNQYI